MDKSYKKKLGPLRDKRNISRAFTLGLFYIPYTLHCNPLLIINRGFFLKLNSIVKKPLWMRCHSPYLDFLSRFAVFKPIYFYHIIQLTAVVYVGSFLNLKGLAVESPDLNRLN